MKRDFATVNSLDPNPINYHH